GKHTNTQFDPLFRRDHMFKMPVEMRTQSQPFHFLNHRDQPFQMVYHVMLPLQFGRQAKELILLLNGKSDVMRQIESDKLFFHLIGNRAVDIERLKKFIEILQDEDGEVWVADCIDLNALNVGSAV